MGDAYTFVGFGDSITMSNERKNEDDKWINVVGRSLRAQFPGLSWEARNAGVGGNTSREGLARIEKDVLALKPDFVTVEFGGNDATPEIDRHVTPGEYLRNLRAIKDKILTASPKARIFLMTFPPVINQWHSWRDKPDFDQHGGLDYRVETYRELTRRFAADEELTLIDIDMALRSAARKEGWDRYVLPDGVHLTARANYVVANLVFAAIADVMIREILPF